MATSAPPGLAFAPRTDDGGPFGTGEGRDVPRRRFCGVVAPVFEVDAKDVADLSQYVGRVSNLHDV